MSDAAEIIKSGAVGQFMDLIHKLAGPACEEFGLSFGDKARAYRLRNLVATAEKTKGKLKDAGLPESPVPTRLLLPIIENASVEDNETLQDMWAGLLATASNEGDSVSPSFIETLKQLTPEEAHRLNALYDAGITLAERRIQGRANCLGDGPVDVLRFIPSITWQGLPVSIIEAYERLGLIQRVHKLAEQNSGFRKGVVVKHDFTHTSYARIFIQACKGPWRRAAGV